MRVTRLPGIHHDSNVVVIQGKLSSIVINSGTSWYQMLQEERIRGTLDSSSGPVEAILLSNRRFPFTGGCANLLSSFENSKAYIGEEGISSLQTGDFFSTWANRFDSDMPQIDASVLENGSIFPVGDGEVEVISLPGSAPEEMGFHIPSKKMIILGSILPRADRPSRWDLPGGSLVDLLKSLKRIKSLDLEKIVPMSGPAIVGKKRINEVLNQHLEFFENCVKNDGELMKSWPKPSRTALWFTPPDPWKLDEKES